MSGNSSDIKDPKEYDVVPGTARQLALVVLDKITADDSTKVSYIHEDKSVHYVTRSPKECGQDIAPGGLTYITVCKGDMERRVPFLFLLHLERTFQQTFLPTVNEHVEELQSNNALLPAIKQLVASTESGEHDPTGLAKSEIEQVKNIMVDNVERILERGERINLLISKTDRMNNNSLAFRRRTVAVRRSMWWKNVKLTVLLIIVVLVLVYLGLGFYICGLPLYDHCLGPGHGHGHGNEPQPQPEPLPEPQPELYSIQ